MNTADYLRAAQERRARYEAEARAIIATARAQGRHALTNDERARFDCLLEAMESENERIADLRRDPPREQADAPKVRAPRPLSEYRRELEEATKALTTSEPPRAESRASRWRTALHEAGHSVACLARGGRLHWASVERGATSFGSADPGADAIIAYAGTAACRFAGVDDAPSGSDLAIARQAVARLPGGARRLPGAEAEAEALVAACWPSVQAVAGQLFLHGTLEGEEIERLARSAAREARLRARPMYAPRGWCGPVPSGRAS